MVNSLRTLLAECIDYAGLFPPARLPLPAALENYLAYVRQSEAWMLGRFVCPAKELSALSLHTPLFQKARRHRPAAEPMSERIRRAVAEQFGVDVERVPETLADSFEQFGADSLDTVELLMGLEEEFDLHLSDDDAERAHTIDRLRLAIRGEDRMHGLAVIGTVADNCREFFNNLRGDVQAIVEFQQAYANDVQIETLELRLPSEVLEAGPEPLDDLLRQVQYRVRVAELPPLDVFVELPLSNAWERSVVQVLEAIEGQGAERIGLKVRTGGVAPSQMPTPEQLAFFIDACRVSRVIWKATAGLHHPLYHPHSTDAWEFGFLNLLVAAVLASSHRLKHNQLAPILSESSIRRFGFDDESLLWGEYRATLADIERARRQAMTAFGSCSVDEPQSGLRALGFM